MAKVTVTICDICKQRIATKTCPICGRDICDVDTRTFTLEFGIKFGPKIDVYEGYMCEEDYRKLQENLPKVLSKLSEKLSPQVIEEVLKEAIKES